MATCPPQKGDSYRPTTLACGAHGTLRGIDIVAADGQVKARRFAQVPFAKPPVGERRWRKPEPLGEDADWSQVKGEEFGGLAPQPIYEVRNEKGELYAMHIPEAVQSEDCLTANIWTPPGPPPAGGWPVWLFYHGGWLQIGNPAMTEKNDPANLVGVLPAVVVVPGYRLGVFGFLASEEIATENADGTAGNFGFWDQRLAIEWTAANIHHFGGDADNICIAGLSAGAYSVEMQLAYELNADAKPLIKRAMMFSNALPAQPKDVAESQAGFDGLLEACGIDAGLSGEDKMRKLRAVPMGKLVGMVMGLKIHTFRAVSDGAFVHKDLYKRITSGDFARRFASRGMSLLIGETADEEVLYGATNPPSSLGDVAVQVGNYYAAEEAKKLVAAFPVPQELEGLKADEKLSTPEQVKAMRALFGKIVSHGQVYVSERTLVKSLVENGVRPEKILRFRVAWKPAVVVKATPFPNVVTHADDQWAWWYLTRFGFSDSETTVTQEWLAPLKAFLAGDDAAAAEQWYGRAPGGDDIQLVRELRDGKISIVQDDRWERCMEIARACE